MEQIVDRYQLLAEIGIGGMGTVYRALDRDLQREVALKLLPAHFSRHESFAERFRREARVIGSLEHPNIVPIYDVGEESGRPFLIMRLLTGGTLQERVKRPDYNMGAFLLSLQQIAQALTAAHAKGIVHRDIKPSNILFDDRGTTFLSDFGIAKILNATTQLTGSGLIGTPAYMAPEQFSGKEIDGRCDQYALAVVVFEALTGRLPFVAESTAQIMFKHLSEPPPDIQMLPENTTAPLNHALKRALAKEPADRYPTARDFVAALQAAVTAAPTLAATSLTLIEKTVTTVPPGTTELLPSPPRPSPVPDPLTIIDGHYQRGLEAMSLANWWEAVTAFDQVLGLQSDYLDARTLRQQSAQRMAQANSSPVGQGNRPPPVASQASGEAADRGRGAPAWLPVAAAAGLLGLLLLAGLTFLFFRFGSQTEAPDIATQLDEGEGQVMAGVQDGSTPVVTPVSETAIPAAYTQSLQIVAAGPGAQIRTGGQQTFEVVATGDQLLVGPGAVVHAGDSELALALTDGTTLFLAPGTELEFPDAAASSDSDILLLLTTGQLLLSLVDAASAAVIEGPTGASVRVTGLAGVAYDAVTRVLAVDCFSGICLLNNGGGDLLSLRSNQFSEVGRSGSLGGAAEARPTLYCDLSPSLMPCPTATLAAEPTVAASAQATEQPPPTQPSPTQPPPTQPPPTQPPPTQPPPTQPPPTQPPPTQPPPTQPPPTQPPPTQPPPTQPPPTQPPPTDVPPPTYTAEPP